MLNTHITLAVVREGRPISFSVEMSGEDLQAALASGGNFVALPMGKDRYTWVNPAHVAMGRETGRDEGPQSAELAELG